jgi:TPR repeat protein
MIEHNMVFNVPSSQRIQEAVELYEKSAQQGNSEALTDLGFLYEKQIIGEGEQGLNSALENYKKAVELANPRAMNNFAGMFLAGKYLTSGYFEENYEGENEREAFTLYEQSADLGYSKAITNLGICYLKGIHVEKDTISARKVLI